MLRCTSSAKAAASSIGLVWLFTTHLTQEVVFRSKCRFSLFSAAAAVAAAVAALVAVTAAAAAANYNNVFPAQSHGLLTRGWLSTGGQCRENHS